MRYDNCLAFGLVLTLATLGLESTAHAQGNPDGQPAVEPAPAAKTTAPASAPAVTSAAELRLLQALKLQRKQNAKLESTVKAQKGRLDSLDDAVGDLSEQIQQASTGHQIFSIYGFTDVSFLKMWVPSDVIGRSLLANDTSFIFGNLNLYFNFKPGTNWRVLVETRLLLQPLGKDIELENTMAGTSYERTDVSVLDYSQFGGSFDHGAIELERARIDWTPRDWLNFGVGLFLTPFGVWNVDHGSPARLMVQAPYLYAGNVPSFPERQLGLMLYGRYPLGSMQLGYALTLSNGRGPAATLVDFDEGKAVGARLEAKGLGELHWQAGFSFFYGPSSDFKRVFQLSPEPDIHKEDTIRFEELGFGVDLSLRTGPWTLVAEGFINRRTYEDPYRPSVDAFAGGPGGLEPDSLAGGAYLMAGYQLPLEQLSLTPYLMAGYTVQNDNRPWRSVVDAVGGINWRIIDNVFLKLEYHMVHWPNEDPLGVKNIGGNAGTIHALSTQLAVAFFSAE